ncbi:hypothetical protein [Pedobacter caeni]|uniref:Outer membrane protein beta-barrel domain-containing protein n=1 Tax=Pedobacter caeni TaxID=288992 RepID=A0A1M5LFD1_9SPHI|nr:hypothetical protein [Pedobacter caeni]SHG63824.1 hypothetical protein SAMN04488522_106327 [Pedobacter caeni]
MKKQLLVLLICMSVQHAFAQTIIQDNKGQTSVDLKPAKADAADKTKVDSIPFGAGLIKFSTIEKKIELNYYQYFRPLNPSFLSVSASGEIKNSIGSVFSTGNLEPGANVKIKYGKRLFSRSIPNFNDWEEEFKSKNGRDPSNEEIGKFIKDMPTASDLWLVTNAGFSGSKFKLFSPDSAYASQFKKINFSSPEFNIGFNYWNAKIANCTVLLGATLGIKQTNNFDDLVESTAEDVITKTDAASGSSRKVTEKNTVYKGKYNEVWTYPLNIDLYFKPQKFDNVAFLAFSRTEFYKGDQKAQTKLGVGFYLLRKNDMFDPVFGINIDYKDVGNADQTDDDKKAISKLNVGLVFNIFPLLFRKKG